jgi:hypothetical protein
MSVEVDLNIHPLVQWHGGDWHNTSVTNDFKAASPTHPLFGPL